MSCDRVGGTRREPEDARRGLASSDSCDQRVDDRSVAHVPETGRIDESDQRCVGGIVVCSLAHESDSDRERASGLGVIGVQAVGDGGESPRPRGEPAAERLGLRTTASVPRGHGRGGAGSTVTVRGPR